MPEDQERVRNLTLLQLKGWAGALVDAIDKHTPELLSGGPSTNPKDLEIPREKVRRLVRQIGEIGVAVEKEVFVLDEEEQRAVAEEYVKAYGDA